MARKKGPKLVLHLISDDLRREYDGKVSLIGTYLKNDFPMVIPSVIPKICFHFFLKNVSNKDRFSAKLLNPDDKEAVKFGAAPFEAPVKAEISDCVLTFVACGVRIEKAGTYKFLLFANELEKELHSFTLQVRQIKVKDPSC